MGTHWPKWYMICLTIKGDKTALEDIPTYFVEDISDPFQMPFIAEVRGRCVMRAGKERLWQVVFDSESGQIIRVTSQDIDLAVQISSYVEKDGEIRVYAVAETIDIAIGIAEDSYMRHELSAVPGRSGQTL